MNSQKQIHLVLYGAQPQHARENLEDALTDAKELITKMYRENGGANYFGSIPLGVDPIIWWSNRVPPQNRVSVLSVDIKS